MERDFGKSQIKWLPFMLFGVSFLRCLMMDKGITLDNGFILFADEGEGRQCVEAYCRAANGNGKMVDNRGRKKVVLDNFCVGFLSLSRHRIDIVEDYLDSQDFFPVVIAEGKLPAELRMGHHYIFHITKNDVKDMMSTELQTNIKEFWEYVTKKVDVVCHELSMVSTSSVVKQYSGAAQFKQLFKMLVAVGKVLSSFLRETYDEDQVEYLFIEYLNECKRRLKKMPCFADGLDVNQDLTRAIRRYVEKEDGVVVKHVLDVKDVQELPPKMILFDENEYYITENMFRNICKDFLFQFTWKELKEMMADTGLIKRDKAGYYTFKKELNINGKIVRIRFMRIDKDIFREESDQMLLLEEVLKNE